MPAVNQSRKGAAAIQQKKRRRTACRAGCRLRGHEVQQGARRGRALRQHAAAAARLGAVVVGLRRSHALARQQRLSLRMQLHVQQERQSGSGSRGQHHMRLRGDDAQRDGLPVRPLPHDQPEGLRLRRLLPAGVLLL